MSLDSNVSLDKGMVIQKKGNYVLVHVGGDTLAIPSEDFHAKMLDGNLEFRASEIFLVQLVPQGQQIGLGVVPADKYPMGYHTLHLTKESLVWYDLTEDSPIDAAIRNQRSGLITSGIQ